MVTIYNKSFINLLTINWDSNYAFSSNIKYYQSYFQQCGFCTREDDSNDFPNTEKFNLKNIYINNAFLAFSYEFRGIIKALCKRANQVKLFLRVRDMAYEYVFALFLIQA